MDRRSELHEKLVECLGTRHVYYQPPESVRMVYPCIVYSLNGIDTKFADDLRYSSRNKYNVIVIDKDPDSVIPYRVMELPHASFSRHYTADNLNHFSIQLYY